MNLATKHSAGCNMTMGHNIAIMFNDCSGIDNDVIGENGVGLNHDQTVRAIASRLDLAALAKTVTITDTLPANAQAMLAHLGQAAAVGTPAQVRGGIAVTTVFVFLNAWNEFLFALTFIVEDDQRTVPVGISLIAGATAFEIPWGSIMAASVIVTLPLLGLVLVFQKKIVSGLTAGAVKG